MVADRQAKTLGIAGKSRGTQEQFGPVATLVTGREVDIRPGISIRRAFHHKGRDALGGPGIDGGGGSGDRATGAPKGLGTASIDAVGAGGISMEEVDIGVINAQVTVTLHQIEIVDLIDPCLGSALGVVGHSGGGV